MRRFVKRNIIAAGMYLIARPAFRRHGHTGYSKAPDQVRHDIERMGIEVERFLKSRADSKAVVLCKHPQWGRCVYKGYPAHANRRQAHALTAATRLTAGRQSPLFPAVMEIGDHYSLEEYVPGRSLSELRPEEWSRVDLARFVEDVQRFGLTGCSTAMSDDERTRIVRYYIHKAIHDVANVPLRSQGIVLVRLLWRYRELCDLASTWLSCDGTTLLTGWSINDLNVRNIVVREDSGELCVIDTEDLGRGHFMFDLVWLVSHVSRLEISSGSILDCLLKATKRLFEVCDTKANALFFRRMLAFLLVMNSLRKPSEPMQKILSAASPDLAQADKQ